MSSAQKTISTSLSEKRNKLFEKLINDLDELCKKFTELKQTNDESSYLIMDDTMELQKFCSKLEFLIQFKLKEKKGLNISSTSTTSASTPLNSNENSLKTSNKDYWNLLIDIFKSSKSFEDAIKYVKSINEIKTNLGKCRAFIRFCLQYHRLADAIQQMTMDEKILA